MLALASNGKARLVQGAHRVEVVNPRYLCQDQAVTSISRISSPRSCSSMSTITRGAGNVFADPDLADADKLKIKTGLTIGIR